MQHINFNRRHPISQVNDIYSQCYYVFFIIFIHIRGIECESVTMKRSLIEYDGHFVFFTSPDIGATVSCVDGSKKYQDFDANEYIWSRAGEVRAHKSVT